MDAASNYVMAGDNARALDWLEKAYAEREPNIPHISCMPTFDPLRAEPRFQALLRRMNLPQDNSAFAQTNHHPRIDYSQKSRSRRPCHPPEGTVRWGPPRGGARGPGRHAQRGQGGSLHGAVRDHDAV